MGDNRNRGTRDLPSKGMPRRDFLRAAGLTAFGLATGAVTLNGCSRPVKTSLKNWAWIPARQVPSLDDWKRLFEKMRYNGVTGALVHGKPDEIFKLVPVARDTGVDLHHWIITLRCTDDQVKQDHPDWFMINRKGVSCLDKPPYIPGYTWLCPSREEVVEYLEKRVAGLAELQGLAGIHLDYIRYPDVILPVGLQPKYNLVQDKEYPEFDFCYCDVCRAKFKKETGLDPLKLPDPSANQAWRQYRYRQVTDLVNRLVKVAHGKDKQLTAAVFPSPSIARRLVRQDWPSWNLDSFHPMMYHKYYNEDVPWIGEVTKEGVQALAGKAPLYSGVLIKMLTPAELAEATKLAIQNGAGGVTLFTATYMTDDHWKALRHALEEIG